ncbi:MAG TPA: hypothetical protein VHN14_01270 [Kofleriaceae bacterium]|nr:hypothetical protein [Kofleriaceae bacterium]
MASLIHLTSLDLCIWAAALALCVLGCGARPRTAPAASLSDEVTLYRDRALVKQRVDVVVPPADTATVSIKVAAGVDPDDLVILDRGELVVSALRVLPARPDAPGPVARAAAAEPSDDPLGSLDDEATDPRHATVRATPTELELVVAAPHAGPFAMSLAYPTDRLAWDAAYTLTTTAARDRALLRGAVAIRNTSGIALRARTYVVDAELGAWRDHATEELGTALGRVGSSPSELTPARDLGIVPLGDGETRVELLAGDPPRKLRSVLVYDPIGTRLDHPGVSPISDPAFGVADAAPTRITESFEIDRDERTTQGLPAGPVRLFERHPDGSLAVLGESRLFDAATRVVGADTVAIGTAEGVTGHRERRDWAKDSEQKRFSEEFLLTIDNARPRPVEIVLREHLYRGQNWTLAYQSAPAAKEGPQQIALRTAVPANGRAKVLYVVVYTW